MADSAGKRGIQPTNTSWNVVRPTKKKRGTPASSAPTSPAPPLKKGSEEPKGATVETLDLEDIHKRRFLRTEILSLFECSFDDNPRGHAHQGVEAMARIAAVGIDPQCDMIWYETPGKK